MRITVNISEELAAQAQSRGLTPESYVEHLIADRVSSAPWHVAAQKLSMEEFDASLDELTRCSDKIPALPDEALSRETFYRDHD